MSGANQLISIWVDESWEIRLNNESRTLDLIHPNNKPPMGVFIHIKEPLDFLERILTKMEELADGDRKAAEDRRSAGADSSAFGVRTSGAGGEPK